MTKRWSQVRFSGPRRRSATLAAFAALLIAGCGVSLQPPLLRDPRTGAVVNCDTPPTREYIGIHTMVQRDCVRGYLSAGYECANESCERRR